MRKSKKDGAGDQDSYPIFLGILALILIFASFLVSDKLEIEIEDLYFIFGVAPMFSLFSLSTLILYLLNFQERKEGFYRKVMSMPLELLLVYFFTLLIAGTTLSLALVGKIKLMNDWQANKKLINLLANFVGAVIASITVWPYVLRQGK